MPHGCEAWLHPRISMRDHADRCRGHPWVDEIDEVAVVPTEYTSLIAAVMDADLLGAVSDQRHSRAVLGDGRAKSRVPTPAGRLTIETPIAGIRPRRWLTVAIAATERLGFDGLVSALDPEAFYELEAHVLTPGLRGVPTLRCPHHDPRAEEPSGRQRRLRVDAGRERSTNRVGCGVERSLLRARCTADMGRTPGKEMLARTATRGSVPTLDRRPAAAGGSGVATRRGGVANVADRIDQPRVPAKGRLAPVAWARLPRSMTERSGPVPAPSP